MFGSRCHRLDIAPAAFGLAAERTGCAEGFFQSRSRLPAERRKEPDGGLFDELVFGVGVGAHGSKPSSKAAISSGRGNCPFSSLGSVRVIS